MYLISSGSARLAAEILRYISETSGSPGVGGCPETPSALLCGKTGVGGTRLTAQQRCRSSVTAPATGL